MFHTTQLISHDETERRGRFYDMLRNTSLFEINGDLTIDAGNMCNEMRFLNNTLKKSSPDVRPVILMVNGGCRIGFFALRDIPAQTEMTFSYGFDLDVDGKHIAKLPQNGDNSGEDSSISSSTKAATLASGRKANKRSKRK